MALKKPHAHKGVWAKIMAKAAQDPKFRQELKANPKEAIKREAGIQIPPQMKIVVHENTPAEMHITLPQPALSDTELEAVAGGRVATWSCACGPSIG